MAAEYIAQRGNLDVVLCERGIRTFEPATRNTLDISAVPVVQADQPPAGHRRPLARRRAARTWSSRSPAPAIARRRRRRDRRRAPRPRDRAVRRPAGAARQRPARARAGRAPAARRSWAAWTRRQRVRTRLTSLSRPCRLGWPTTDRCREAHVRLPPVRSPAGHRPVLHQLRPPGRQPRRHPRAHSTPPSTSA